MSMFQPPGAPMRRHRKGAAFPVVVKHRLVRLGHNRAPTPFAAPVNARRTIRRSRPAGVATGCRSCCHVIIAGDRCGAPSLGALRRIASRYGFRGGLQNPDFGGVRQRPPNPANAARIVDCARAIGRICTNRRRPKHGMGVAEHSVHTPFVCSGPFSRPPPCLAPPARIASSATAPPSHLHHPFA